MTSGYDLNKARPLEIRLVDHRAEGGMSEAKAAEGGGVMADAFLLMRVLVEEDKIALSFSAIEGWSAGEMSLDALFNLWIALASKIAQREGQTPDHEKLRAFAERVLAMMSLTTGLTRLGEVPLPVTPGEAPTPEGSSK